MSAQNEFSATAVQLSFDFERRRASDETISPTTYISQLASVAYLAPKRENLARRQELDAYTRVIEYAKSLRRI